MSKVPSNLNSQIRPGAVIGSENLPFESMIFSDGSPKNSAAATPAQGSQSSRYSGPEAGRKVAETTTPAFSKWFRPKN